MWIPSSQIYKQYTCKEIKSMGRTEGLTNFIKSDFIIGEKGVKEGATHNNQEEGCVNSMFQDCGVQYSGNQPRFKFKQLKQKIQFFSSLAIFQGLSSHMWLVAAAKTFSLTMFSMASSCLCPCP